MKYLLYLLPIFFAVGCVPIATPDTQPTLEIQESVEDPAIPKQTNLPGQTIRFLALGDSYTIGQGVPENERWPLQLATQLSENGIDTQITIIARTGWTTNDLLVNLSADPPQGLFNFVSLLIGVNDQYRNGEPEDYRIRFRGLLEHAIPFAGDNPENVIVISIPDWEVTPYAQGSARVPRRYDIDDFNAVNLQEAQNFGVRYVDITPISRQVVNDLSLLAPDLLHPSGKMYALWVKEMLPLILELMGK